LLRITASPRYFFGADAVRGSLTDFGSLFGQSCSQAIEPRIAARGNQLVGDGEQSLAPRA
jgi:hypothetical protein